MIHSARSRSELSDFSCSSISKSKVKKDVYDSNISFNTNNKEYNSNSKKMKEKLYECLEDFHDKFTNLFKKAADSGINKKK